MVYLSDWVLSGEGEWLWRQGDMKHFHIHIWLIYDWQNGAKIY